MSSLLSSYLYSLPELCADIRGSQWKTHRWLIANRPTLHLQGLFKSQGSLLAVQNEDTLSLEILSLDWPLSSWMLCADPPLRNSYLK